MGINLSLCLSSTAELDNPQLDQNDPFIVKDRKELKLSKPVLEIQTDDMSSSPHSANSGQSVLTFISPTKEKKPLRSHLQSPLPLFRPIIPESQQSAYPLVLEDINGMISRGETKELAQYIDKYKVDLTMIKLQSLRYTALHVAVLHNQLPMVQYLLSKGVDVDAKDKDGQSAVYLAYSLNYGPVIDALVAHKAAMFGSSPYSPYASSYDYGSVKSLSVASDAATGVRSRSFSVSSGQYHPDEGGCAEIFVPRFSSFRSIHSIKSIQRDREVYKELNYEEHKSEAASSPFTTDSATTAAAYNQKQHKPIGKRLRKAAGKVIHLVLPKSISNNNNNGQRRQNL